MCLVKKKKANQQTEIKNYDHHKSANLIKKYTPDTGPAMVINQCYYCYYYYSDIVMKFHVNS